MNVIVYGAGALGSFFGGLLSTQHQVTLVGRPAHVQAVKREGLRISGETSLVAHPAAVTSLSEAPDAVHSDLVLLTVKAFHTRQAVEDVAAHTSAPLLSLQNGLGNYERMAEVVPETSVLAGTTTTGATLLGEGQVREAGRGVAQIGSPSGAEHRARDAVALLLRGGIDCERSAAIDEALWAKAIVNAAINPLTALTGLRNGMLVEVPELRELLGAVAEEAANVARRCGVFVREGIAGPVEAICRQTAQNRSSMLQDVSAGRRSEIDFINGEIARRAEERGLPAPLCRALTALVHGLEAREEAGG